MPLDPGSPLDRGRRVGLVLSRPAGGLALAGGARPDQLRLWWIWAVLWLAVTVRSSW